MFVTNTDKDRAEMLSAAGASSFAELTAQLPKGMTSPGFKLPAALTEPELAAHIGELAKKNKELVTFAGGGAYNHFIPAAVNQLSSRGEFLTAYTPYQAEASQGTLQAIYEFQSSVCALFEMDAANASMYDGASALAEAVNACMRITSRTKVVIPQALHPHYKQTLKTYFAPNHAVSFIEIPCPSGTMDMQSLKTALAEPAACVVAANPNFFGCIEAMPEIAAAAKAAQTLFIAAVNPLSLGALSAPGSYGADFAVAEGQCLGNPLHFGGPYLGIFACKKEHMRHIPGRICGITTDTEGKRAFVLTLQAREQHIRREKAASNICSNEALCALRATIYLALIGPNGLKEAAELNIERAHILAEKLEKAGFKLLFKAPFFNEFIIQCPGDATALRDKLIQHGFLAGIPMGQFDPAMKQNLLVCATEMNSEEDIEKFAAAMRSAK